MKKIKEPKYKVGDIVENKSGWKRKIASVNIRYEPQYKFEKVPKIEYSYYGELLNYDLKVVGWQTYPFGFCGEAHLIAWSKK